MLDALQIAELISSPGETQAAQSQLCINFACCKAFVQDLDDKEKIRDFFDMLHKQVV